MSQEFSRRSFGKLVGTGGLLLLSSCARASKIAPIQKNTETPTLSPSKTQTPNSVVFEQKPTIIENKELFFESPVYIPPSLMLHSKDLPQLINLLPILKQAGYQAMTYENYYDALLNKRPLKNPILLSIDDLVVTYLSPVHEKMISKIEEAGMCGTLGIVTRGTKEEVKPEIWQYLKTLQDKGWELANHTENHVSLPSCTDKYLRYQIEEAHNKILDATGKAPVSLILPYGIVAKKETKKIDQRIMEVCAELGIKWVVGIWSGKEFSGKSPFYVGRLAPGETVGITMKNLASLFVSS
jgi:hypothetical protein